MARQEIANSWNSIVHEILSDMQKQQQKFPILIVRIKDTYAKRLDIRPRRECKEKEEHPCYRRNLEIIRKITEYLLVRNHNFEFTEIEI